MIDAAIEQASRRLGVTRPGAFADGRWRVSTPQKGLPFLIWTGDDHHELPRDVDAPTVALFLLLLGLPDVAVTCPDCKSTASDLGAMWRPFSPRPFSPIGQPTDLPEAPRPNAEAYPTLAASGFIFSEAIDRGPVTRPACACPTCGRLTQRVIAP